MMLEAIEIGRGDFLAPTLPVKWGLERWFFHVPGARRLSYDEIFCCLSFTGADPLLVLRNSRDGLAIQLNS